ncbi:MAG: dihydroorotate dehydrogenase, partial [Planctomycetota bacterium]
MAARAPAECLRTALGSLSMQSPLIAAAGTCGVLDELAEVSDLRWLGALTTKSLTPEPREGNAPWRLIETRGGMLNAIGLANPGIDAFVRDHAP